jgi:hypothetical protein
MTVVRDILTSELVEETARLMNGLITTADITRAVAEGRLHDVS